MSLLRLEDLTVTYRTAEGAVPAVRGVSLELEAGTTLGVAGESGSGKSTLAATVLRLTPPTATVGGRVLLDGEDVLTMSFGRLRAVRWAAAAIVFQGALHSLNPLQRVGQQIAEPVLLHDADVTRRQADQRVRDLLGQVGLAGRLASAYPHQLSGGQKQRMMIAMALACRPRLLIADEPTTALDVMVQAQVLDLLTTLVRDLGLGLVLISHDLSVLGTTCERLAVMYAGRVVEEGPSADVLARARHPYTRALSAAFPTIGDAAARFAPRGLPGDPPWPGDLPPGCPFHPRCGEAVAACAGTDVRLRECGGAHRAACVHVGTRPVEVRA
ncbi:MAG: peptide/nickel transport system ATP-binding protein [Actinomycetota bacterium]|nr:peptide/nickel transport system ATP-binding protein [Actinomycetota bacterium]